MANLSNNDIAKAIYLMGKEEKNVAEFSKKVIDFLYKKRLLSKSSLILDKLREVIDKEDGRLLVKISSIKDLDKKIKEELIDVLKKRYKVNEVTLEEIIDKNLIGGLKIEANGEIINLTIKNKIDKLQEYLNRKV